LENAVEENPKTDPQNPGATGDGGQTPPAATNQNDGGGAATDGDEMISVKKSDYNNLISARDRNFDDAARQSAFIESMAQEKGINTFLNDNKDKYPDLTFEDLKHVEDPADLEEVASRMQRRLEDHAQSKILNIENPKPPTMSPEDRAAKEAEIMKNGGPDAWEKVLALRMQG
jgi:hypothetical protein